MTPLPRKSRERSQEKRGHSGRGSRRAKSRHTVLSSHSGSRLLSADALANLDQHNQREALRETKIIRNQHGENNRRKHRRKSRQELVKDETVTVEKRYQHKRRRRRVVSGELLEEGEAPTLRGIRGGEKSEESDQGVVVEKLKKRLWLWIAIALVGLLGIIIAAAMASKKKGKPFSVTNTLNSDRGKPSNANLGGISEASIPAAAKGTYLDPFSWYDTTDFNVTYTNDTVGGLPVMGLNSTWDDSARANSNARPISVAWGSYADTPVRGVNLGGWLSLEPFITPSLFDHDGVIDEYTLVSHLGPSTAKSTLEKHYATFVSEQTFKDIANAGLDHVRIPFSYWAVAIYDSDPYVFRISWRYLLRGIEWARKQGLRVNLDLHGLPGSQNGWNHSGRQGPIGWLNGTNGSLNAQRSLDVHDQLSRFFSQDRYKNIVAFYGLANEPKMTALPQAAVLDWSSKAFALVRNNGISAHVVFGDGFMGLPNWKGKLQGNDGLVLDAHQYVIFNKELIAFNHTSKVNYVCTDWTSQSQESISVSTGFGPTIFAEWSQADTDCAPHLNNVGWGNRWTGTYNSPDENLDVLSPGCPLKSSQCDCTSANADPSTYSNAYKQFLQMFAEAQMASFEAAWGWFYWTWKTEAATQWSYQLGLAAGILPQKAYAPDFHCSPSAPSFSALPESF